MSNPSQNVHFTHKTLDTLTRWGVSAVDSLGLSGVIGCAVFTFFLLAAYEHNDNIKSRGVYTVHGKND